MSTPSVQFPTWHLIRVERNGATPLYAQIDRQIRAAITDGAIPLGARLPPTRTLASELRVSRNTVLIAYERLAADGFVSQRTGDGTFACLPPGDASALQQGGEAARSASRRQDALSVRGREISQVGVPLERTFGFDLSPLVPAADHFPYARFSAIFRNYWQSTPAADVVYGEPGGSMHLRRQIRSYLGISRGIVCEPEQIIICGSTLQALEMTVLLLLEPGEEIVVEDPGHIGEIVLLNSLGQRTVSLRCDREGLDLGTASAQAQAARMVVVTPVGQFPFGSNLGAERCAAILDWARERGGWIFEDDANSEYRWIGEPRQPLIAMDRDYRVIYTSSFNRALAPGLRLAYVVVPPDLVDAYTAAQQIAGFHFPLMLQNAVAEFLRHGQFARHLRKHRAIYRERAEALIAALRREFGPRMDVPELEAGLQLTVVMKEACDDLAVSDAALRLGLDVPALSPYCRLPDPLSGFLLGFGNTPVERIAPAVGRLARAIDLVRARPYPASR
jgi:GntR family transcriptional regulator / MocR family aminotransferase